VSRLYPKLAAADANRWKIAYQRERRQRYPEIRPMLAAYVADEYLARRAAVGWTFAFLALRAGDLDPRTPPDLWPVGADCLRRLARFLVRNRDAGNARISGVPKTRRCGSFTMGGATFSHVVSDGVNCVATQQLLSRSTVASVRHRRGR
jgi:hypothetical protein